MGFFALFILATVVVGIRLTIKQVPQGYEYTIERFGRYSRTLEPGLNFIVPVVEWVGLKINVMEQVLDIPSQEIISSDNAMVRVDAVVFFQIVEAAKAAYAITNLESAIRNLSMTNIRTVLGSLELDSMLSQRDQINSRLLHVIDDATTPWGIKVTRIEIKEIAPPSDLVESMGRQMKAERDKRAKVLEAEGNKQSEVLEAEGRRQATILEAEGRKESTFRDAEARERMAAAEAKATEIISMAIKNGNIQAINYFVAQKYIEALGSLANSENQKVLMLPVDATSMLGSFAGIAEIAKDAFAGDRK